MVNEILGVKLDSDSLEKIYEKIIVLAKDSSRAAKFVVRPNAETVVYAHENPEFKTIINSANVSIPDGIGVYLAAKILGKKVSGRFGGPSSTLDLLNLAQKNSLTVYLLGDSLEIVKLASRNIKKTLPNINILGFHDGYFIEDKDIVLEIQKLKPDLIFVGMGVPKQEKWIFDNLEKFEKGVFITEGGSFAYLSGKVQRAPVILQKAGFEWLFRLINQPWRLKRQLALFKFSFLVLKLKY